MDHKIISVSIELGGLLDAQLNSIHKQTNRDRWKDNVFAALSLVISGFLNAKVLNMLCRVMVKAADATFSKRWFSEFNCSKNRHSSRFLGLELLVAKVVKSLNTDDKCKCDYLIKRWFLIDYKEAFKFDFLKYYKKSKYYESRVTRNTAIQSVIDKCMENFSSNKGGMIKSILEQPFHKVVLDHLVIDDKLVLDPIEVKSRVDSIMVNWTKECISPSVMPFRWAHQYVPLDYVKDDAFFNVMNDIRFNKLVNVILDLPNGKAAGLSGISNKLWKHCGNNMLECLLSLLNSCLNISKVLALWKRAWDSILINTKPIVLIKTARKILSKLLSNRISLACFRFVVLWGDNFSVLKSTSTQSSVFAVGSIVEDTMEKNREIKMCDKFVLFFENLHVGRINRVMTNFGLSDEYCMLDSLDQEEVFFPLLWKIFYDLLLCKVKDHKHLYGYRINTNFVAKSGRIESSSDWSSFFATASMQHILNIVDEFFEVNDIAINSEKTVVILINKKVSDASLHINGLSIFIAKQGKAHKYLDIFLSTDGLFKPSLAKAQSDIRFFSNIVFKKALMNKQFVYLVSSVLQLIVSYCTQFSFVSKSVCLKWDVMLRKGLKSKVNLFWDFPSEALHYSSLYGVRTFEQIQTKGKMASLVWFSNVPGILGHLFLRVSSFNNFLTSMVRIFLDNDIYLANNLPCAFCGAGHFLVLMILGSSFYFGMIPFLKCFGVVFDNRLLDKDGSVLSWRTFYHWKRLSSRSPVPLWYSKVFVYMDGHHFIPSGLFTVSGGSNFFDSERYLVVWKHLHESWFDAFAVYTDGSLFHLGTAEVVGGAAAYFPDAGVGIGIEISGLLSSTMAELYAVVLVLQCVPSSCSVVINTNSQTTIDACASELGLIAPDFRNKCWVKDHSGDAYNDKADALAGCAAHSNLSLPMSVRESLSVMLNGRLLLVAICKRLYDKCYPGVLCLMCGDVELSDHVFTCRSEAAVHADILLDGTTLWKSLLVDCSSAFSLMLHTLFAGCHDSGVYM
ncbi:hypothetical protein G9A89_005979 [Geosiphon pyriformis]|nr:hypothetical protein G9A89_005979 [Geosiphon pyriformis]